MMDQSLAAVWRAAFLWGAVEAPAPGPPVINLEFLGADDRSIGRNPPGEPKRPDARRKFGSTFNTGRVSWFAQQAQTFP